jgi:hypothetical protein
MMEAYNNYTHLPCSLQTLMQQRTDGNPNSTMSAQRLVTHIMGDCPRCSAAAKSLYVDTLIDAIEIAEEIAKDAAAAADIRPPPAEAQPPQSHRTPTPLPDECYDEHWTREDEQAVINNRRPLND